MGAWPLVSLYRLPAFNALPFSDEILGVRNFFAKTAGMSLCVKAMNFALRAFAISFARDISFMKNSPTIVIKI